MKHQEYQVPPAQEPEQAAGVFYSRLRPKQLKFASQRITEMRRERYYYSWKRKTSRQDRKQSATNPDQGISGVYCTIIGCNPN